MTLSKWLFLAGVICAVLGVIVIPLSPMRSDIAGAVCALLGVTGGSLFTNSYLARKR
jgi:drug/metabolite transporter (DMT)-like permease